MCVFTFLGDQASPEAILAIQTTRLPGSRVSGGDVDAANSHSSKTPSARRYQ